MTPFEQLAKVAFSTLGHAYLELDVSQGANEDGTQWDIAVIDCLACGYLFSYDVESGVVGGPDTHDDHFNQPCPRRAAA